MTFAHPDFIVPAIAGAAIFAAISVFGHLRGRRVAARYSNLAFLIAAAAPRAWPARVLTAAWIGAVTLVLLAFAGPRVHAMVPVHGGAVVLCVDTSGSMAASDVSPTRAGAALAAMRTFIAHAPADVAIGVVSFAGSAQEIVPPTRDRDALTAGLAAIPAPNGATAIGDALALAQRILPPGAHRAIVLVTDGENNTGSDPLAQARVLGAQGITLDTIGIGTDTGALIPGTLQDAGIDEDALRQYARVAGGTYSRAGDALELRKALAQLGRTTAFTRGTVDLSLDWAAAGAAIMTIAYIWMKLI